MKLLSTKNHRASIKTKFEIVGTHTHKLIVRDAPLSDVVIQSPI